MAGLVRKRCLRRVYAGYYKAKRPEDSNRTLKKPDHPLGGPAFVLLRLNVGVPASISVGRRAKNKPRPNAVVLHQTFAAIDAVQILKR